MYGPGVLRMVKFGIESRVRLATTKDKPQVGRWLAKELARLGPAYIKWGQFLSTRSDVLEKEVTLELARLQDDIQPVPYDQIQRIIQEDLGPDAFSFVDPQCLASASIGQVHEGRTKDGNKRVAIKVQKPGVVESIVDDIRSIKFLNSIASIVNRGGSNEIADLVRQYETFLSSEIDYERELRNMQAFQKADLGGRVRVPRVYPSLSTKRVLTMEFVGSTKITDVTALKKRRVDSKALAYALVDVFLRQITTTGLVHCDPHPGNVGVDLENPNVLVLYDFGNVVRLSEAFRSNMKSIVFAVYQRDVDEFVDLLVNLNVLTELTSREKDEIRAFFDYFFEYLETLDFQQVKDSLLDNDLVRQSKITFKVNQDFLSMVRVFSLLDGTCVRLDPQFDYNGALRPYVSEVMTDVRFMDVVARKDLQKIVSLPKSIKNLERKSVGLGNKVERSSFLGGDSAFAWMTVATLAAEKYAEPEIAAGALAALVAIVLMKRKT